MLGGLILSGASVSLADVARGLSPGPGGRFPALAIAAYVMMLVALHEALAFPLAFYYGFVLDRRYGLSSVSFAAWLRDRAKAVGLGLVLAIGRAENVCFAVRVYPVWWWLISASLLAVARCVLAEIVPHALLPMY